MKCSELEILVNENLRLRKDIEALTGSLLDEVRENKYLRTRLVMQHEQIELLKEVARGRCR